MEFWAAWDMTLWIGQVFWLTRTDRVYVENSSSRTRDDVCVASDAISTRDIALRFNSDFRDRVTAIDGSVCKRWDVTCSCGWKYAQFYMYYTYMYLPQLRVPSNCVLM